jgi:hypothetical protein
MELDFVVIHLFAATSENDPVGSELAKINIMPTVHGSYDKPQVHRVRGHGCQCRMPIPELVESPPGHLRQRVH